MASRRMFSCELINSDRFNSMSFAARALYFALMGQADDDGVISGVMGICRMGKFRAKDIDDLVENGFLLQIDEGLYLVAHWRVHNCIRRDRYRPSAYKDKLGCISLGADNIYSQSKKSDDGEVLAESTAENGDLKPFSDGGVTTTWQPSDNQLTTTWQPTGNPGKDRLGKDRLGEDRSGEDRSGEDRIDEERTGEKRIDEDRIGEGDRGCTEGAQPRERSAPMDRPHTNFFFGFSDEDASDSKAIKLQSNTAKELSKDLAGLRASMSGGEKLSVDQLLEKCKARGWLE